MFNTVLPLKAISHQWVFIKHLSQVKNCVVCLTDQKRFQHSRYVLSPHDQMLHKFCIYAFKYIVSRTVHQRESIYLLVVRNIVGEYFGFIKHPF